MPHVVLIPLTMLCLAGSALAQVDPSGIDFVTIDHPGNAAWQGNGTPGDQAIGRGAVDYSFRIGRDEVTSSQWCEFMNAALDRPANDRIPFVSAPSNWGAVPTTPQNGGSRWTVPAGHEMHAAGGIDWRTCAIFCNWLDHNKSSSRDSFLSGSYDVSTFGYIGNIFTDQEARSSGAQYFLPTWDELLKASHYDPNRFGPGQGGWWLYNNGTISPSVGGAPPNMGGSGQANFGFSGPPSPFSIPLGAYTTQSPWGLFDTGGGTSEWTESINTIGGGVRSRMFDGSAWNSSPGESVLDAIYARGSEFPSVGTYNLGFRIAASVPSPSSLAVASLSIVFVLKRRRAARLVLLPLTMLCLTGSALAQVDPSGIDFVTIGSPGNAAWAGDGTVGDHAIGRGSVSYDYRIGRYEITTAQFVDFFNAALDRPGGDRLPFVFAPGQWGAAPATPNNPGGQRWTVPRGTREYPGGRHRLAHVRDVLQLGDQQPLERQSRVPLGKLRHRDLRLRPQWLHRPARPQPRRPVLDSDDG